MLNTCTGKCYFDGCLISMCQTCGLFLDDINFEKMNTDESEKLEKIKRRLLHLFADSLGWEFRVKGSPLTDIIEGVDFKLQMVKGKRYGDFAVDLCELTGKNPEDLSAEQLLN